MIIGSLSPRSFSLSFDADALQIIAVKRGEGQPKTEKIDVPHQHEEQREQEDGHNNNFSNASSHSTSARPMRIKVIPKVFLEGDFLFVDSKVPFPSNNTANLNTYVNGNGNGNGSGKSPSVKVTTNLTSHALLYLTLACLFVRP